SCLAAGASESAHRCLAAADLQTGLLVRAGGAISPQEQCSNTIAGLRVDCMALAGQFPRADFREPGDLIHQLAAGVGSENSIRWPGEYLFSWWNSRPSVR